MEKIIRFFKDEDGLELSEYAVMGALIVAALLLIVISFSRDSHCVMFLMA